MSMSLTKEPCFNVPGVLLNLLRWKRRAGEKGDRKVEEKERIEKMWNDKELHPQL